MKAGFPAPFFWGTLSTFSVWLGLPVWGLPAWPRKELSKGKSILTDDFELAHSADDLLKVPIQGTAWKCSQRDLGSGHSNLTGRL